MGKYRKLQEETRRWNKAKVKEITKELKKKNFYSYPKCQCYFKHKASPLAGHEISWSIKTIKLTQNLSL